MSTTTVSTNTLPSNVPKLDVSGKNWAIYRIRFTRAVQSKGVWGHLEGSTLRPSTPVAETAAAEGESATVSDELTAWKKDEALALDLLTQRIPDSTVIRTANQPTAAAMWASYEVLGVKVHRQGRCTRVA